MLLEQHVDLRVRLEELLHHGLAAGAPDRLLGYPRRHDQVGLLAVALEAAAVGDAGEAVALRVARQLVMYLKRPSGQSQFSVPLSVPRRPSFSAT